MTGVYGHQTRLHILDYKSIVFDKFYGIFSPEYGGRDKKENKKRAEIWALKSFRDRSNERMEAVAERIQLYDSVIMGGIPC